MTWVLKVPDDLFIFRVLPLLPLDSLGAVGSVCKRWRRCSVGAYQKLEAIQLELPQLRDLLSTRLCQSGALRGNLRELTVVEKGDHFTGCDWSKTVLDLTVFPSLQTLQVIFPHKNCTLVNKAGRVLQHAAKTLPILSLHLNSALDFQHLLEDRSLMDKVNATHLNLFFHLDRIRNDSYQYLEGTLLMMLEKKYRPGLESVNIILKVFKPNTHECGSWYQRRACRVVQKCLIEATARASKRVALAKISLFAEPQVFSNLPKAKAGSVIGRLEAAPFDMIQPYGDSLNSRDLLEITPKEPCMLTAPVGPLPMLVQGKKKNRTSPQKKQDRLHNTMPGWAVRKRQKKPP